MDQMVMPFIKFQSTRLREARPAPWLLTLLAKLFQSTRLREARRSITAGPQIIVQFQSTRLREARRPIVTPTIPAPQVSIHAPA